MSQLSLREAARATGTSRSTLLRRIQSGRLPATRTDDGVYAIDPEQLLQVCPPRPEDERDRQTPRDARPPSTGSDLATHIRAARLEAEVDALKSALEAEKKRCDELRDERDRWHAQAERLAFRELTVLEPPRPVERGLKFLRWAKAEASI